MALYEPVALGESATVQIRDLNRMLQLGRPALVEADELPPPRDRQPSAHPPQLNDLAAYHRGGTPRVAPRSTVSRGAGVIPHPSSPASGTPVRSYNPGFPNRKDPGGILKVGPASVSMTCRMDTMIGMDEEQVFVLVGEEGFHKLVAAFYRRIPDDEILGPMYPRHDLAGAEQRLRDFLVFRFGGPPRYIEERGHPRLRARHFPFAIDQRARDRWMANMNAAIDEAGLAPEAVAVLRPFLDHIASFLINR